MNSKILLKAGEVEGTAEAWRSGRDAELLGRWSAEQLAERGDGIKEGGL
jgi:hypothetical protein